MNYPNGMKFIPNKVKTNTKEITYANRGMTLEKELNDTNIYYREKDKAYIYKKPTPIKISKVDYKNNNAKILEAFFETPSTTDYNGIYKGYYIDFEAKETKSNTSFPLSNIHPHQIKHLQNISKHNGIAFLIVRFTNLNLTFLLLEKDFSTYIENNNRKSIPLNFFKEKASLIKDKFNPRIDYLEVLDKLEVTKWKKILTKI